MAEKLKAVKFDVTLGALITIALGVVFLVWPVETVSVMARIIAAAIIATGVIVAIFALTMIPLNIFGTGAGALIAVIGVWFFIRPEVLTNFIPIVIGIWLIIHGIRDLMMTVEGRKFQSGSWLVMGLLAIISIIFGVFCICYAFELVKATMVIFGIMLIIDGFTDMLIVHKVNQAAKTYKSSADMMQADAVDYNANVIDATDDVKPIEPNDNETDGI